MHPGKKGRWEGVRGGVWGGGEGDRGRVRSFQYDRALLMATIIVLMTLDTNTKKERRGVA